MQRGDDADVRKHVIDAMLTADNALLSANEHACASATLFLRPLRRPATSRVTRRPSGGAERIRAC
jgi:hypothetical protein